VRALGVFISRVGGRITDGFRFGMIFLLRLWGHRWRKEASI
jgi:hypothetical protein